MEKDNLIVLNGQNIKKYKLLTTKDMKKSQEKVLEHLKSLFKKHDPFVDCADFYVEENKIYCSVCISLEILNDLKDFIDCKKLYVGPFRHGCTGNLYTVIYIT